MYAGRHCSKPFRPLSCPRAGSKALSAWQVFIQPLYIGIITVFFLLPWRWLNTSCGIITLWRGALEDQKIETEKRPRRSQCPVCSRCQKQALKEEQANRDASLAIFPCLQRFPAQCFPKPELLSLHLTVIGFLLRISCLSSNSCRLSASAASRYLLDL